MLLLGQRVLAERDDVKAVFLLQLGKPGHRRSRQQNGSGDLTALDLFQCFRGRDVNGFHVNIEQAENSLAADIGCAPWLPEVHRLAPQIFEFLNFRTRDEMIFGIVELSDVADALIDIAIQLRIKVLEKGQMILLGQTHVDPFQEQDIDNILPAAAPGDRQHAHIVALEIIEHVGEIGGVTDIGAVYAAADNTDRAAVALVFLLFIR